MTKVEFDNLLEMIILSSSPVSGGYARILKEEIKKINDFESTFLTPEVKFNTKKDILVLIEKLFRVKTNDAYSLSLLADLKKKLYFVWGISCDF